MPVEQHSDRRPIDDEFLDTYLPGTSKSVVELRQEITKLNSPIASGLVNVVLIRGESGAGKNHLARVIAGHRKWRFQLRKGAQLSLAGGLNTFTDEFAEISLPNVPDELIESELFGHKRGAFSGAVADKVGLLGGGYKDILLDEIGDASSAFQAKLLRVVEHGCFRRLGADPAEGEESTSARLLFATNKDLVDMVRKGRFRPDLYWRTRLFVITVPALRDQPENIEAIARGIERDLNHSLPASSEQAPNLSESDITWARTYRWPGNVRQLRHSIIRWMFERLATHGRATESGGETATRSLQEVVRGMEVEDPEMRETAGAQQISNLVRSKLGDIEHGRAESPGTVGDFIKGFVGQIEADLYTWYTSGSLTDDQLQKIFTGHTRPDSIRNMLLRYRK